MENYININKTYITENEVFVNSTGCGCCTDSERFTTREYLRFLKRLQEDVEKEIRETNKVISMHSLQ